ncbi:MAG: beta-agarase [Verrucomicrobiota bacterium]
MKYRWTTLTAATLVSLSCHGEVEDKKTTTRAVDLSKPHIVIEPEVTRAVGGVSEVDRERYFSVCDPGTGFDKRMSGEGVYDELVNELGVTFGRQLGPVKWTASQLPEDPERPGYADVSSLKDRKLPKPGEAFYEAYKPNLDVAAHGNHNAYPEYMGKYELEGANYHGDPEWIPENIDAAAELAAAVFQYNYTDFDRPKYFEPLNEPHWMYFSDEHMAAWHLAVKEKIQQTMPEVEVGGMCQSVSYFFRDNYQNFNGMKNFYDNTEGKMDFYSFHSYDYFKWEDDDFRGRVQSGSPLEGSLDLLQNYIVLEGGDEVDVVISEHGGYVNVQPKGMYDGEALAAEIAAKHFPEETWENELKKRSIIGFAHVSSIIANTLTFIDHPHTVVKSVPFLLPNTWNWDEKYYAGLYVPENYTDKTKWVPTTMLDFYKLFRDVDGRRVKVTSNEPDLQTRAFVDGSKLFLVVNNQSWRPESVDLYGIEADTVKVRRFGRNKDYTAYYTEDEISTPETLKVAGRESMVVIAEYDEPILETAAVNEVVCYADKTRQPLKDATFNITVPVDEEIDYAVLRVAMTRPSGMSHEPTIIFNGKVLEVPLEDAADRFDKGEYGTTKFIQLDPADLLAENTVTVGFSDSGEGAVGAAVIRAGVKTK